MKCNDMFKLAKKLQEKNIIKTAPSRNRGRFLNYVFLCGGISYENDNRELIKKLLSKRKDIICLYSEKLAEDNDFDLLSFEELLVEFSTNVIIILESYGSACELGAFTYIDRLLNKIIVINDDTHKNTVSFINNGPIKKLEKKYDKNVFYEKFEKNSSKERPTLIISTKLSERLIQDIPTDRTFKAESIVKEGDLLIVNDLMYFSLLFFEIISFFGPLKVDEILKLLKILYDVENISIHLKSGNEISSDKHQKKFKEVITILLEFMKTSKVITYSNNTTCYYINYIFASEQSNDLLTKSSILFKSGYLRSSDFFKDKSKAIFYAKKRGLNIWKV